MKKKLISFVMVISLLMALLPTAFATADTVTSGAQPDLTAEGVIVVKNNEMNDAAPDSRFRVGHTDATTGWTHGNGEIVSSGVKLQYQAWQTDRIGYGGKRALGLNNGWGMYADWCPFPENDVTKAGAYEIWVYLPELEATMWDGDKPFDKVAGGRIQLGTPGLHAVYMVHSKTPNYVFSGTAATAVNAPNANVVEPRYYVNQYEVLGGKAGWFKLGGTHYFGGTGNDYVRLSTYRWYENAYASAVAFVPVSNSSSAKLTKVHTAVSAAKTNLSECSPASVTRILAETADVKSNQIVREIPSKYAGGGTDNSGNRLYRKAYLVLEAEDANAKIYNGTICIGTGVGFLEKQIDRGTSNEFLIRVVSADESVTEYYDVSVVANEDNQNEYRVTESATYTDEHFEGVVGRVEYSNDYTRSFTPVRYPTNEQKYNNENVALCAEWNTRLMLENLGAHATWTTNDVSEGLHAVYVYPNMTAKGHGEHAEVIINHAGLRESVAIKPGQYHAEQVDYLNALNGVYVGTFYFDGNGNESISIMKNEEATDWSQTGEDLGWSNKKYHTGHVDARLRIQGMHLESAPYYAAASDFDGVVVSTDKTSVSATKTMLAEGNYILPIAAYGAETVKVKLVGSNSVYESIKINGQELTLKDSEGESVAPAQCPVTIPVVPGFNTVNVEIKLQGKASQLYTFDIFCETTSNSATTKVDADLIQTTYAPLSTTYAANTAGYLKENVAEATFALSETGAAAPGYYKVLAWKPGFTFQTYDLDAVFGNNTTPYGTDHQRISINTGVQTVIKDIDWSATDCRWVELGQYYFDGSADCGVTFKNSAEDNSLLDTVKFLKLNEGVEINGVYYTESELANESVIETDLSSVSIKNFLSSAITVNGNTIAALAEHTCLLTEGINTIVLETTDDSYEAIVVKKGSVISWKSKDVTYDGESSALDSSANGGLNGNGYAKSYGLPVTFKPSSLTAGPAKVYAYFIPVSQDELYEGDTTTVSVKANIGGESVTSQSVTPETEGWMEISEFNFSGDGQDSITLDEGVFFISAIKIVPDLFDVTQPKLNIANGKMTASVYAYTSEDNSANIIVAVYDKMTHKLIDCNVNHYDVTQGVHTMTTKPIDYNAETNTVKAFVWKDMSTLTPLIATAN